MKNRDCFEKYLDAEVSRTFTSLREKRGQAYYDIAFSISVNKNTYYGYEKGTRTMPLAIFKKLCVLYNIDPEETFTDCVERATQKMLKDLRKKEE